MVQLIKHKHDAKVEKARNGSKLQLLVFSVSVHITQCLDVFVEFSSWGILRLWPSGKLQFSSESRGEMIYLKLLKKSFA